MNDIKVSLTIELPGSTMLSKEECLKTTQKVIEKKTKSGKVFKKSFTIKIDDWDKMDPHTTKVWDKEGSEIIKFYTRKSRPAKQSINLRKEAYTYMTSSECPVWHKINIWSQMNAKQRLEAHLQRIAEHLGGTLLSYKVFED